MSAILVSEPQTVGGASGTYRIASPHYCYMYQLRLAYTVSGVLKYKLIYQLMDASTGTPLSDIHSYIPYSPSDYLNVNFTNIVNGLVSTSIPFDISLGAINDNLFIKSIYLRAGYVEFNTVNCQTNVIWNLETEPIKIINSVWNFEDNPMLFTGSVSYLSHLPTEYYQCWSARNNIWVIGGVQVDAHYELSNGDTFVLSSPVTENPTIFPLHPFLALTNPETVEWIRVTFNPNTQDERTYVVYLEQCCCDDILVNGNAIVSYSNQPSGRYVNIMFLSSLGSRNVISFDCDIITSYKTESSYICRNILCIQTNPNPNTDNLFNNGGALNQIPTTRGTTIFNKKTSEQHTYKKTMPYTLENELYLKDFISSSGYHIQQLTFNRKVVFVKCYMTTGEIAILDTFNGSKELELTCTFVHSNDYKTQKQDR